MKKLTADQLLLIEELILEDSLTHIEEVGDHWFEADLGFYMDNVQYARVLRRMGFNVVVEGEDDSNPRPSWDEYFLGIADAVSKRGDCSRRQVGAVVVDKDNRLVSTGYNGSYPGGPSCLAGECPRASSGVEPLSSYDTGPGACVAAHAEQNALLYAGQSRTKGATIYITCEPCDGCLKLIKAAGIKNVVWPTGHLTKKDLYD